jgi:formate hydrogenlyase subunit 4
MAKSDGGLRGLPQAYLAFVIVHIVFSVVAAIWPNKTFHKCYAVAWPVFTVGYLSATTLAAIASG